MRLLRKDFEVRKSYFLEAFGREPEDMAIISFAGCNLNCPYCKRGMQHIDTNGKPIKTVEIEMEELKNLIDEEILKGRKIRLSGGDPCVFQKESMEIANHVWEKHNQKISIAHNGTDAMFIRKIGGLDYLAMDYKSLNKEKLEKITGHKNPKCEQMQIIDYCRENKILVDMRTPIFGDTEERELFQIAEKISGLDNVFWTLRKYNQVQGCDFKEISIDKVMGLAEKIKTRYPELKIGVRNYWTGGFKIF